MLDATKVIAYSSTSTIGSNAAVDEVLNHGRYQGAIESISKYVGIVDTFSTMFVTGVAFLIISVAIWRNVLAGAYAAFPKFWDQVYEAHQEVKDVSWWQRITGIKTSYQNWNMSTLKRFIMRFLPDIKVLTDFEDETLEPKTYFTKAIVQMIGVVMIGVFIYNGYYRDTTVVVARFASELFERTITSVDPIEVYDRIMSSTGTPDFATDNALTTRDQRVNEMAHKAYAKVISKYSDITSANDKAAAATSIEQAMDAWASEMSGCIESDGWDMSVAFTMTSGATSMGATQSDDGLSRSYAKSINVEEFNLNTTKNAGETWYLTGVVTFTKTNKGNTARTYQDLVMNATVRVVGDSWEFNIDESSAKLKSYPGNSITIDGKSYPFKYQNGKFVFTGGEVPTAGTKGSAVKVTGSLEYQIGGRYHTIAYLNITVGSSPSVPTFYTNTLGKDAVFTWGQEIKMDDADDQSSSSQVSGTVTQGQ